MNNLNRFRKNALRKVMTMLFTIIVICSFSLPVFASEVTTYPLEELDITVDIPNDLIVFSRDIQEDDPNLSLYGLTKDDLSAILANGNIYLDIWDKDVTFEIIITMIESRLADFSLCSDTELNALASSLNDSYDAVGATLYSSDIYQHRQTRFIRLSFSQSSGDKTLYCCQYHTVYQKKAINITLKSFSGKIDTAKENLQQSIVDSVRFLTAPMQSSTPGFSPAIQYTDEETGARFTVPENWSQAELTKDRDFIKVKFESNLEEGLTIAYGSGDVWKDLSEEEKQGASRSDVNNQVFSSADMAAMFDIGEDQVSRVVYNGADYFKMEITSEQSLFGVKFLIPITQFYRFENGYAYIFQFGAKDTSPYYRDMETLLASVEYPPVITSQPLLPSVSPAVSSVKTAKDFVIPFANSTVGIILINLLLTVIIHPVPIWIYRYAIRKRPMTPKAAKKLVIVDAIIVALLMLFITYKTGGTISVIAVFVWSKVCYSSLIKGYVEEDTLGETTIYFTPSNAGMTKQDESVEPSAAANAKQTVIPEEEERSVMTVAQPKYCRKCGAELSSDSRFCRKCGTEVIMEEKQ